MKIKMTEVHTAQPPTERASTKPDDEQIPLWTYIFQGHTPRTTICIAVLLLICNIVVSGLGTALSACLSSAHRNRCNLLIIAAIQFFLMWLFVPWIWSIVFGSLLVIHAKDIPDNGGNPQPRRSVEPQQAPPV